MGQCVRRAFGPPVNFPHAAELVGGLLLGDFVQDELTLCVIKQAEVLFSLLDPDDIHEPAGKNISLRTLPSTLIKRCMQIILHSWYVKAYLSRWRNMTMRGRHSRS